VLENVTQQQTENLQKFQLRIIDPGKRVKGKLKSRKCNAEPQRLLS